MHRLADQPYMDLDSRNGILLSISQGHEKEARVSEVRASIPAWADRPFKDDQANFDLNLQIYQAANPIVQKLETRLANEPGPIWKEMTSDEKQALANWSPALDNLVGYVNSYFPTDTQKYIPQIALWLIAIGAFVVPMFLTEDNEVLSLPFHFGPPPLPPGIGPTRAPVTTTAMITTSQRPPYSADFSKIPGASRPAAIPVQAEVMRPAVSQPSWRPVAPPGASGPRLRSFTTPLGPMPVTAATTQAAATGAPRASSNPHGPKIYPKFRDK